MYFSFFFYSFTRNLSVFRRDINVSFREVVPQAAEMMVWLRLWAVDVTSSLGSVPNNALINLLITGLFACLDLLTCHNNDSSGSLCDVQLLLWDNYFALNKYHITSTLGNIVKSTIRSCCNVIKHLWLHCIQDACTSNRVCKTFVVIIYLLLPCLEAEHPCEDVDAYVTAWFQLLEKQMPSKLTQCPAYATTVRQL